MNTVWIAKVTDPDNVLEKLSAFVSRKDADDAVERMAKLFAADNNIPEDEIRGHITLGHTIYVVRSQCFEARKYPVFDHLPQNGTGA